MAIPEFKFQTVGASGLPDAYQSARGASVTAFGGGAGAGLQQLGAGAGQAGQTLDQMTLELQARANETFAKEADTRLSEKMRTMLFDPQQGYYNRKGKDALAGLDAVQAELRKAVEDEVNALPNESAKELFGGVAQRRLERALTDMTQYATRERDVWRAQTAEARATAAVEDAILKFDRPDDVRMAIATGKAEVFDAADAYGWSPEYTQQKLKEFTTLAHGGVVARMVEKDPAGARAYFNKHRAEMDAETILKTEKVLDEADKIAAVNGHLSRITTGQERLRERESGGDYTAVNQLGYAGAYQFGAPRLADLGVYQPGDAEEMRKWGGSGQWSGYFTIPGFENVKTLQDFLGNPEAQEAVFQMHRGMMDKEIMRNGFGRYIGREVQGVTITQEGLYNMLHLGGVGGTRRFLEGRGNPQDANGTSVGDYAAMGAQGAAPRTEFGAQVEEALQIEDPAVRDEVLKALRSRYELTEKVERERMDNLKAQAFEMIDGGATPDQLPASIRAELGREYVSGLWSYVEARRDRRSKATDRASHEAYWTLSQIMAESPDVFRSMDLLDPEWRIRLTDTEWKGFVKAQMDMRAAKPGAGTQVGTVHQQVTRAMTQLEIDTAKPEGAARAGRFERWVQDQVTALETSKGGDYRASYQDVDDIIQRGLTEIETDGLIWNGSVRLFEASDADFDPADVVVPDDARQEILAEFQMQAPGVPVTEDKIRAAYLNSIGIGQ